MSKAIQKWTELYRINFFQPKTKDDRNDPKEPLIITKEIYWIIKDDLINNRRFEINWELYNPYTVDTVKRFKVDENVETVLKAQNPMVQKKVKEYMRYEKKHTNMQRLESMIEKAKEELYLK